MKLIYLVVLSVMGLNSFAQELIVFKESSKNNKRVRVFPRYSESDDRVNLSIFNQKVILDEVYFQDTNELVLGKDLKGIFKFVDCFDENMNGRYKVENQSTGSNFEYSFEDEIFKGCKAKKFAFKRSLKKKFKSSNFVVRVGDFSIEPSYLADKISLENGEITRPAILGCSDPYAANYIDYGIAYIVDDGSCEYTHAPPIIPIYGCTNPRAINYSNEANYDDNSCYYSDGERPGNGDLEITCNNPASLNYLDNQECKFQDFTEVKDYLRNDADALNEVEKLSTSYDKVVHIGGEVASVAAALKVSQGQDWIDNQVKLANLEYELSIEKALMLNIERGLEADYGQVAFLVDFLNLVIVSVDNVEVKIDSAAN